MIYISFKKCNMKFDFDKDSLFFRRAYSSQTYQSSSSSHKRSSSIREEKEEYSYQENRKMSGYSKYAANDALSNGVNGKKIYLFL